MGITFNRPVKGDFSDTLNLRVNEFFKNDGRTRNANSEMVIKTMVMYSLYIIPFVLVLFSVSSSIWFVLFMYLIMGIGASGLGLSVMHDAVHGSYSKSKRFNTLLGWMTMHFIGGSALNWKVQHNVLHHTYPNIDGLDEDISPKFILRLSPSSKLMKVHKFQFIYAWFLYSISTLNWLLTKDFGQLRQYEKSGMLKKQGFSFRRSFLLLLGSKLIYLFFMLALPFIVTSYPVWYIILGFVLMHMVSGSVLSSIFQPAHVTDRVLFMDNPEENLSINSAEHQLYTTLNFANGSKWFTWFVGGLNFQIEHHLFPHICHVHYRPVSRIVKETAKEFDLPYYTEPTFWSAINSHTRQLRRLGTLVAT